MHPDLVTLGRSLRDRLERTLDTEMEAARALVRRRRTLRDRFLDAEDAGVVVTVATADGVVHRGVVEGVGPDHFDLVQFGIRRSVALCHVVSVES